MNGGPITRAIVDEEQRLHTQRILDKLDQLQNGLRQALADHLWADIYRHVSEYAYAANQAIGVPLYVPPQTANLELITSLVVVVPESATGLVQLDDMILPVSAGLTAIPAMKKFVKQNSTRSLTLAGAAGPCALLLGGDQHPTFGQLAP